jgi:hypothetical protein
MVKIGSWPKDPATRAHLEFVAERGFNAIWVYSGEAGVWNDPAGPSLDPAFLEVVRFCRERGLRILVSLNPVADTGGSFVFSDSEGERRIRAFFRLLKRHGVHDFALSFDDVDLELRDVRDVAHYGASAAPAHLDLARRVLKRPGRGGKLWLGAAVYSDWQIDDEDYQPYADLFLEVSTASIRGSASCGPAGHDLGIDTREDRRDPRVARRARDHTLRQTTGEHDDAERRAGAPPGTARKRDPKNPRAVSAYPRPDGPASAVEAPAGHDRRFPARSRRGCDPDVSWNRAIQSLAGPDPATQDAVKTQAMEWGGWVGTLNYHYEDASPRAIAEDLGNPALMATWSYTLRRYPDRMAAISKAADTVFRDDVLQAMARRLAVARVLHPVLSSTGPSPPLRAGPPTC